MLAAMIRDPDTLNALLDSVRRFVRERLVPAEHEVADTDQIPPAIVAEMKQLGLFGLTIPEEHGGLALTMEEEALVMFEMGYTSPAFRSVFGTTVGIGAMGIVIDGTPEQKALWLPKMATGEVIASFALTEPDAGSDAASLRTTAIRDGDHYVVNGGKRYITNAPHASVFTLMARTDPSNKGAGGVSAFIVDAKSPGISLGKIDKKMGQRGAHTCDVMFDNVRVPAANLIGAEGQGFKTFMTNFNAERLGMAAQAVGYAQACLAEALAWARQRVTFGQPLAERQVIRHKLVDMARQVDVARCLVHDIAWHVQHRAADPAHLVARTALAKVQATQAMQFCADTAVQILGAMGYMRGTVSERLYREVKVMMIGGGSEEILKDLAGRQWGV